MTNEPGSRWPGRLLAGVDGVAAWTFLMLSYISLSGVMRLSMVEVDKLIPDVESPPEAFSLLIVLAPESGWCLLLGISLLALAYAWVAWVRDEGLTTGRLFVWTVVVLEFLLVIAILPLVGSLRLRPPLEDHHWLDEVVFLLSAVVLCVCCFCFVRSRAAVR